MPEGYAGTANHAARLLSFFSLADVHMTDKESPAQVPYLGWSADFGDPGMAQLNPSAYSPIILARPIVSMPPSRPLMRCIG